LDDLAPVFPPKYIWLNPHGEKEVDCGLGPEFAKAKLMLTSSLFDGKSDEMVRIFKDLPPPPGKALYIGDATVAPSRPWHARWHYYMNSAKAWLFKAGVKIQYKILGDQPQGKEAMEKMLEGVGVVYFAGGDHMFLMNAIRTSGFGEALLPRFLDGSIAVVGRSAGTIDAGVDVGFSTERQSERLLHGDFSGLSLAGRCSLRPHFGGVWLDATRLNGVSEVFDKKAEQQFERVAAENITNRLVTLEDGQALLVKGGRASIVGDPLPH